MTKRTWLYQTPAFNMRKGFQYRLDGRLYTVETAYRLNSGRFWIRDTSGNIGKAYDANYIFTVESDN